MEPGARIRTTLRWSLAIAVPFAACLALTGPVALPLDSGLLAHVDAVGHVWHYWHFAHALETGEPLFESTLIYFPMGGNHLLHRGGHLLVLLSYPITALTGSPVLAHNLLALGSLLLACAGGAALGARFSRRLPVMLLGSFGLGMCWPVISSLYEGQIEECLIGLLAFTVLAVESAVVRGGAWRIGAAGLALGLTFVANMEFMLFLAIFGACGAVAVFAVSRDRLRERAAWSHLVAVGVVGALLASPLGLAFTSAYQRSHGALAGYEGAGTTEEQTQMFFALQATFSAAVGDLIGVDFDGGRPPPRGAPPRSEGKSKRAPLALLVLAAMGCLAAPRKGALFWGLSLVVLTTLALGPVLKLANTRPLLVGGEEIHLPLYYLSEYVPFFSRLNFPHRYLIAAYVPLVALAARGGAWMLSRPRVPPPLATGAVVALAVLVGTVNLSGWTRPPVLDAPGPTREITASLAEEEGDFAVILLPTFEMRFHSDGHLFYLQQCAHQRPTIDGMGAQFLVPGPLRDLVRINPLVSAVIDPPQRFAEPTAVTDALRRDDLTVLGDMGFRHVVLVPGLTEAAEARRLRSVLKLLLGEPRAVGDAEVWTLERSDGELPVIESPERSREILLAYLAGRG